MKKVMTFCAAIGMLLTAGIDVKGVIINPCLMLHFDGNRGQTTTVDSSLQNHSPINFYGNAQLDTADKENGSASLLLGGKGDYLTIPDSPDWDICGSKADNWTIDFWVKMATAKHSGNEFFATQCENSKNQWSLFTLSNGDIQFQMMSNGKQKINVVTPAREIKDTDWHWIALCKVGSLYGIYLDGQQVAYTKDTDTDIFAAPLTIGGAGYDTKKYGLAGHLDEFRITHGNLLDAFPNAYRTNKIEDPPCSVVPEPATIALLGLGALSLLRRKRGI
jgi:hypothetical protein